MNTKTNALSGFLNHFLERHGCHRLIVHQLNVELHTPPGGKLRGIVGGGLARGIARGHALRAAILNLPIGNCHPLAVEEARPLHRSFQGALARALDFVRGFAQTHLHRLCGMAELPFPVEVVGATPPLFLRVVGRRFARRVRCEVSFLVRLLRVVLNQGRDAFDFDFKRALRHGLSFVLDLSATHREPQRRQPKLLSLARNRTTSLPQLGQTGFALRCSAVRGKVSACTGVFCTGLVGLDMGGFFHTHTQLSRGLIRG